MKILAGALFAALSVSLFACDRGPRSPVAYGAANAVIVIAHESVWEEAEESLRAALEPTIFIVRDERFFEVTHVSPAQSEWGQLRMWRQVIAIGRPDDPWVAPVLSAGGEEPEELPGIVTARSVWALNQTVSAILLPEGAGGEAIVPLVPRIREELERRYRDHVLQRMFVSGMDEALQARLLREAGFSLTLPRVYRNAVVDDSVYVFRNDFPDPGQMVRSILVTWESGVDGPLSEERAVEWRDGMEHRYYARPMVTLRDRLETRPLPDVGAGGIQVQGLWESPPEEWPGGGTFLVWMVPCPDQNRTYLIDAWLYAPGRDKLEYVLQLQAILSTFRCGGDGAVTAA